MATDLPAAVGTGDYFINLSNYEEALSFIEEQSDEGRHQKQQQRH